MPVLKVSAGRRSGSWTRYARLGAAGVTAAAALVYIYFVITLRPAGDPSTVTYDSGIDLTGSQQLGAGSTASHRRSDSSSTTSEVGGSQTGEADALPFMRSHPHQDAKYRIYDTTIPDPSHRCKMTGICVGDFSCGSDGLGCVTSAKERQDHIRNAVRWSWAGYRWDIGCWCEWGMHVSMSVVFLPLALRPSAF